MKQKYKDDIIELIKIAGDYGIPMEGRDFVELFELIINMKE